MEMKDARTAKLAAHMDRFARRLTELSHQYGIGIEGGTLYEMESEDKLFRYSMDEQGRLVRV